MIPALLVVLTVVAALAGLPGRATAVPGDPPSPISLTDLGSSSTISFPGQQGQVSLSLPVPPDLAPATLRGTTQVPDFVTGGSVDVLQGDRLISRTPISTAPSAPIELSLRGVNVTKNAADLTLRAYLQIQGFCQFDPANAFRITGANVTYTGREAIPTTVAGFLPPILRGLTIYVPSDVQQDEGAAAVNLAAAVTANYGAARVPVETVGLPRANMTPPEVPGPLERQVVINSKAPQGLSLQNNRGSSYLVIGGSGDDLVTQTQLLTSDLSPIALSSSAVAGTLHAAPQLPRDVQTLADLGVTDQSVTSASWPSISFGIDQTRIGRPSKGIRVQLIGTYSPGQRNTSGIIAVQAGDRTISTISADGDGSYNQWVDIPDDVVKRYTAITLTYQRGDLGEACGTGYRSSLSLSSAGEVQADPADPPQPSGFQSLPQALMPRTQLAWTKGDVGDVSRAVTIVAGMQQMSTVPLGIDVVSMDTAGSSDLPAILIAADGTGLPELTLPLQTDGRTLKVVNTSGDAQTSSVTLNPGINFGALEVTRQNDRSVLVATSTNDTADLDGLLRGLSAGSQWSGLEGDAILQVAGNDPVTVASDQVSPVESSDGHGSWWTVALVVIGAALLAGLVALATILARRRRRRPEAQ
ncbi:hypothetical protein AAFP30_15310 [Gordonia sp. CPCC 205515]|uniref:hypothetical protein n=1 Tax=Gordonia sp. CPCC 205515 TaxID=3140791 RepID=UPI003AF3EE83